jgi:hypothetical protein
VLAITEDMQLREPWWQAGELPVIPKRSRPPINLFDRRDEPRGIDAKFPKNHYGNTVAREFEFLQAMLIGELGSAFVLRPYIFVADFMLGGR